MKRRQFFKAMLGLFAASAVDPGSLLKLERLNTGRAYDKTTGLSLTFVRSFDPVGHVWITPKSHGALYVPVFMDYPITGEVDPNA